MPPVRDGSLDLLDALAIGILAVGGDGRIVHANRTLRDLLGVRETELTGRTVACLCPDRSLEESVRHHLVRLPADRALSATDVISCPHDGSRELHFHWSPWHDGLVARVEQARTQDANLKALFEAVADGIVVATPAGRIVLGNPAAHRMLGYTDAELRSLSVNDLHPAGTRPRVAWHFARMAEGRFDTQREMEIRRRDGSLFLADISVTPFDLDGAPHFLGLFHDVTAAHRATAALRERERDFRLLLDSTSEAIYGIDAQGVCQFVNPACLRMLGYDRAEELLGQPMHDLIHHHHADGRAIPETHCRIYAASRENRPVHVADEVLWRKDGSHFPVEYWSHPMLKDGRVCGAVVSFVDITEKRRAESHLRQAAAVFASTMEGILVTDPAGRIVAMNRSFCRITGYEEPQLLGQRPNMLRSGRHDPAFYAAMWESIRTSGHWRGEVWNRRPDGEVYALRLAISAVRDESGRLTNYVGVIADISHMKEFEANLEHLAHHDALTGLPNRMLLHSLLGHVLDRAKRERRLVAVLFSDLDRFKNVNDTLGHAAGDALLQTLAGRLRQRIRGEDVVARLGGDEFVVVLGNLRNAGQAAQVAQELLGLLTAPVRLPAGQEVYVGSSIGIACYPEDGANAEDLLKHADAAMYVAKEEGRGTCRFFTEAMSRSADQRLNVETELRHALRRNELTLHYQPLFDGQGGLIGIEALARWQHPVQGMIEPGRFIPVAEECGLIAELDTWVLRQACSQAVAWNRAGLRTPPLSVNLSPRNFQQADLLDRTHAILRETGCDPRQLAFEITEGVLMDKSGRTEAWLAELRALGIRLAIDDFGTGYSSLAYLKRFPVDRLKIDQSFVRDLFGDDNDREIAATIIAMGRNLKMEVLAEGVETEEQLNFLKEQGCQYFQGHFFSHPEPADRIEARLAGHA